MLAAGPAEAPPAASPATDALRREILAQCRGGRIGVHQVLWLANRWYPERRVSERLALAETAVWGLLHERLIGLRRVSPPADAQDAGPAAPAAAEEAVARQTGRRSSSTGEPGPTPPSRPC